MSARSLLLTLVALGVIGFAAWRGVFDNPPTPKTKLTIEITGGFAYVPNYTDGHLEIGYLGPVKLRNDTNRDGVVNASDAPRDADGDGDVDVDDVPVICDVHPVGHRLQILRGEIVEFDPPALLPEDRIFDLDQADVTIPALETANIPLKVNRTNPGTFPPSPSKASTPGHWQDLQYVPSIKERHPGTGIRPTWRDEVNGRLVLRGGTINGTKPSDPDIETKTFEFQLAGSSKGSFSITDKTIYEVDVPGDTIELVFTDSALGYKRLKLKAPAGSPSVKLSLRGLHESGTAATYLPGQKMPDFCAFYSLLDKSFNEADWLTVHFPTTTVAVTVPGIGQPSPGYFCDGGWF
jgi:hypothetical protein